MQDGQKSSLTDFPMEILMHILGFLPPKWIVVLRKCCNKTLAAATLERTVWMAALHQVCADHHVFGCTFTVTEMTTLDLERVATSHHRFASRLQHELGEEPLIPMLLRVIPARSDTYASKLVPGGRFMLTCGGEGQAILQLWDLGFASNDLSCSLPIAATEIFGTWDFLSEILVQPTSDGLGVRVLMPSSLSENRVQFSIYEVFPLSASPTFYLVSTLLCTGKIRGCAICFLSDRLAFSDRENVLVWNYAMNAMPFGQMIEGLVQWCIIITGTDLVLIESGIFWIFQIPELQPYAPGTNAIIGPGMPPLRLACPLKFKGVCRTSTYDLPSPSVPRCIDVVGETKNGTSVISRFEIPTNFFARESTNQATDDGQRCVLPTSTHFFYNVGEPRPPSQIFGSPWSSSLCDNSRLVHCDVYELMHGGAYEGAYGGEVKAHLTVMANGFPSGMDGAYRWGTLWELPSDIDTMHHYSLCSMSGRMCATTDDGIYIVDYLIPPT